MVPTVPQHLPQCYANNRHSDIQSVHEWFLFSKYVPLVTSLCLLNIPISADGSINCMFLLENILVKVKALRMHVFCDPATSLQGPKEITELVYKDGTFII